jgi:ABC-type nitrate/sulfonate/bicarbonate transport system substrate-binding protein
MSIAYSTFNVRLETMRKEPELVRMFVRGMVKGLKLVYADPAEASEIAKKQFPTMPIEDLRRRWSAPTRTRRGAGTAASAGKPGRPRAPWCARPAY